MTVVTHSTKENTPLEWEEGATTKPKYPPVVH